MADRVNALGGVLTIHSPATGGTLVSARLPLSARAADSRLPIALHAALEMMAPARFAASQRRSANHINPRLSSGVDR